MRIIILVFYILSWSPVPESIQYYAEHKAGTQEAGPTDSKPPSVT